MKRLFLILLLVILGNSLFAQNVKTAFRALSTINSVEDFPSLVKKYPEWRITMDTIVQGTNMGYDPISCERLLTSKKGDTLINDLVGYKLFQAQKILKHHKLPVYTCKYIALDFNELDIDNTDSLKATLIEKHKNGTDFKALAKTYSMDGNRNHGEDFTFHKSMFREFTEAVKSHDVGDVFSVDIPNLNWSFVIYKCKPDSIAKAVTFVSIDL